jgi:hypothetical protein
MDWSDLRPELTARGLLPRGELVAATRWIDASKIGYMLGPEHIAICLCDDPRGFQFAHPVGQYVGRDMLLLVRSGGGVRPVNVPARYGAYFRGIIPADTVTLQRAGRVELSIAAFRAHELLQRIDSAR